MDIQFLRTFLEVARVRHFGKAADNLFLTQSAISARVRMLEDAIGEPLFIRQRNNIQLTSAGEKLVPLAEGIVSFWNRAKHEVTLTNQTENTISVSCVPGLWDMLMHHWLVHVVQSDLSVSVITSANTNLEIFHQIREYSLDLAFTFDPQLDTDLKIKQVATIPIILVSTKKNQLISQALTDNFLFVDWGTAINTKIENQYSEIVQPINKVGQNNLALNLLLHHRGAAYLAEQTVREHIKAKNLHIVPKAPIFERIVYAVYSTESHHAVLVSTSLEYFERNNEFLNPDLSKYS